MLLAILDQVIESDIAPQAAEHDEAGALSDQRNRRAQAFGRVEDSGSCGLWRAGILVALLA